MDRIKRKIRMLHLIFSTPSRVPRKRCWFTEWHLTNFQETISPAIHCKNVPVSFVSTGFLWIPEYPASFRENFPLPQSESPIPSLHCPSQHLPFLYSTELLLASIFSSFCTDSRTLSSHSDPNRCHSLTRHTILFLVANIFHLGLCNSLSIGLLVSIFALL